HVRDVQFVISSHNTTYDDSILVINIDVLSRLARHMGGKMKQNMVSAWNRIPPCPSKFEEWEIFVVLLSSVKYSMNPSTFPWDGSIDSNFTSLWNILERLIKQNADDTAVRYNTLLSGRSSFGYKISRGQVTVKSVVKSRNSQSSSNDYFLADVATELGKVSKFVASMEYRVAMSVQSTDVILDLEDPDSYEFFNNSRDVGPRHYVHEHISKSKMLMKSLRKHTAPQLRSSSDSTTSSGNTDNGSIIVEVTDTAPVLNPHEIEKLDDTGKKRMSNQGSRSRSNKSEADPSTFLSASGMSYTGIDEPSYDSDLFSKSDVDLAVFRREMEDMKRQLTCIPDLQSKVFGLTMELNLLKDRMKDMEINANNRSKFPELAVDPNVDAKIHGAITVKDGQHITPRHDDEIVEIQSDIDNDDYGVTSNDMSFQSRGTYASSTSNLVNPIGNAMDLIKPTKEEKELFMKIFPTRNDLFATLLIGTLDSIASRIEVDKSSTFEIEAMSKYNRIVKVISILKEMKLPDKLELPDRSEQNLLQLYRKFSKSAKVANLSIGAKTLASIKLSMSVSNVYRCFASIWTRCKEVSELFPFPYNVILDSSSNHPIVLILGRDTKLIESYQFSFSNSNLSPDDKGSLSTWKITACNIKDAALQEYIERATKGEAKKELISEFQQRDLIKLDDFEKKSKGKQQPCQNIASTIMKPKLRFKTMNK
ncbi:hypothetical protein BC830DRAFT_1086696, partial [Chytriomyces sp. MP71]